jgi:hypothetical protein
LLGCAIQTTLNRLIILNDVDPDVCGNMLNPKKSCSLSTRSCMPNGTYGYGCHGDKPNSRFMRFDEISDNFSLLDEWEDRYRYIIELGRTLAPLPVMSMMRATPWSPRSVTMSVLTRCSNNTPYRLNGTTRSCRPCLVMSAVEALPDLSLQLDDAEPGRMCHRVGSADGIELVNHRGNVKLRRVHRDGQPPRNHLVGSALSKQRQHF